VTAGHTPTSKPFAEAKRGLEIALTQSIKESNQAQSQKCRDRLDQVVNLDHAIGHIVYATTQASITTKKTLLSSVPVLNELPITLFNVFLYILKTFQFNNEVLTIPSKIVPPGIGTPVAKVGIRTGYTEGVIVSTSYVRWRHDTTKSVPNDDLGYNLLPTSAAHAILGNDGQMFSDSGDSGSLMVTFDKDIINAVQKVMAIGMVYAILAEDPPLPSLTFFYPMEYLLAKLNKETGLELILDQTASLGDSWPFIEHGAGRSTYDLK
jgi:hypothetical protein